MTIVDPDAKKPSNWNDEIRGPWVPPEIANPNYKGMLVSY
jgi:calreticulin